MSGAHVRDAGNVSRSIVVGHVRDSGGVSRPIVRGSTRDYGNILRPMFGRLTATASPTLVAGSAYSKSAIRIVTGSTSISPQGTGPYTYAWAPVTGWDVLNPSSATTAFRSPLVPAGSDSDATFVCTVTGPSGSATVSVSASVQNNYGGQN